MKFTALFLALVLLAPFSFGQTKKPTVKPQPKKATTTTRPAVKPQPKKTTTTASAKTPAKNPVAKPKAAPTPKPRNEKAEFEAASAAEPLEKVNALKKFIVDFPKSERVGKARELLVVARAAVADEKLRAGEIESSVALFRLAVEESPEPIPDKLFTEVISKFPYNLYWNGQRPAAFETARAIEPRVAASVTQNIALANFYISVESGADAMRLAEAAVKADPTSSPAYQTTGLAHRLNFDLEKSAAAYAKALELDPESLNSKQSLAEMYRALGKPEDAEKLYREMLAAAEGDIPAQTGLVLSLFDAGKKADAETEMAKSLEANPKNVILLSGAAYWYAANSDADKAVELAEKAVELEPRYVWSYVALARGLLGKQKAVDAERVLTKARSYGNFPTVEYELASARLAAGFYREAAEDLQKYFTVKDGAVYSKLGGRIERSAAGFDELVAAERKASIFTPAGSGNADSDQKLKQLLDLHQKVAAAEPNEAAIGAAVDEFSSGSDSMKVHRQLYAASVLLQKNVALDKVVEATRAVTGNTDAGLDSPNAAAAVMASELYNSRSLAFARNEFLAVPEVPRHTLSAILRGRVEDLAGWALYHQSRYPEAILRLRRAISVLPDKSAWWRSSMWRLGAALAAEGKEKDALDAYVASYKTDKPDLAKYLVVESLYKRLNNGSTNGLEAQIGKDRVVTLAETTTPSPPPVQTKAPEAAAPPAVEITPVSASNEPSRIPRGVPVDPNSTPPVTVAPANEAAATKQPEPTPEPVPQISEASKEVDKQKDPEPTAVIPAPADSSKLETEKPKVENPLPEPTPIEKPGDSPAVTNEPAVAKEGEKAAEEKKADEIRTVEVREQPVEKKEDPKPEPIVPNPESTKAESKTKPLFEPVIITIPGPRPAADKNVSEAGAARPRIVEGVEIKAEEVPQCRIGVSQENISLINNGGTIGLIVTVDDDAAAKQMVATSSSSGDIEITAEPDLGEPTKQRLYVVKSISATPGVYQVRFAAACGKKDVIVTVR